VSTANSKDKKKNKASKLQAPGTPKRVLLKRAGVAGLLYPRVYRS